MPKRRWPARPLSKPDHIGTIGEVIRRRQHMEIYCQRPSCCHNAPVDLEALRSEYGEDYTVSGFIARSSCSRCGGRWPVIGITVTPIENLRYHMGYTSSDPVSPRSKPEATKPDPKQ